MRTLNPTLQWVGPHITVCNYFNYFWTFLADHISEEDATGTVQRVQVKLAPLSQKNSLLSFGAVRPANGGEVTAVEQSLTGDAAELHDQIYAAAVDANGNADCEMGQRGYPKRQADRPAERSQHRAGLALAGRPGADVQGPRPRARRARPSPPSRPASRPR